MEPVIPSFEDESEGEDAQVAKLPLAAFALGIGAVSLVGTVLFEKFVFGRGEARRRAGVRFAHTRQAVAIAALKAGALYALPDEILLGASSED
ncbi:hypothetical protein [Gleimia coleocanis]|nr:hypothetical protein [Gleimia coleocanis]